MGESRAFDTEKVDWAADAFLQPVKATNAFEEVIDRLMQAIKLGVLDKGAQLPPERELAARLSVSRVTLREAIGALRLAGFVESRRGRGGGTFVTLPAPVAADEQELRRAAESIGSDLDDVLTHRLILEAGAAEFAARRKLTTDQQSYLQRRLNEAENAPPHQLLRADARLHLAVGELTGSGTVTMSIAQARMRLAELFNALSPAYREVEQSHTQHRRIVQAILVGDPEGARAAAEEHLTATAALLRKAVRSRPGGSASPS